MKKSTLIGVAIIAAVILLVGGLFASKNNRAISLEEQIKTADSNIQVQEKRRVDLIINLVDCVKSYDKYEAGTLKDIVEARKNKLTDQEVEQVTIQLNVVAEAYPELKASENYKELMNELAITENGIAEYRNAYNEQIRSYNKFTRKFPNKQILSIMGYETVKYNYLEFDVTEDAPKNLFGTEE